MRFQLTGFLVAAFFLFPIGPNSFAQSVTALPHLDVNKLSGAWFEIARYPNKREKLCAADAQELVALDDKARHLQLVDSCTAAKGYSVVHNYSAKIDKQTDGKLKIPTFFPLARPYWVLALAPDNSWLVIGLANHKALWIFAKTPTLDPTTLTQIEALTTAAGYSTATLIFQPQKSYTPITSQAPTLTSTHPAAAATPQ